jgi:ADP-ribose pyrophosphatase
VSSFRKVSEEELLRAWIFKVDKFYLEDPDGTPFDRFVIRHPGAVAVVPVHDDGRVTLVRQYRAPMDAMVLEIPAGTCDRNGEPLEETARRELAEECGLEAKSLDLLLGTWNTPGISDQETWLYLATGLTECASRPDGVEEGFMTIETIHLDDVDALVANGSLKDESTVLGLYMARARFNGHAAAGP